MTKSEQNRGDIASQNKQPEKKGIGARIRELLTSLTGGEKEKDIEVLAGEVEAGEVSLEEVRKEAGDEVADTSFETVQEAGDMLDSLKKEKAPDDSAIAELGALVMEEQRAAIEAQEKISGEEVKEEVKFEAPPEAKKEKVESLFERVVNHAVDFADFDEAVTRLGQHKHVYWDGGTDKDQLTAAFQNMPENSFCFGSWNDGQLEVFFTDAGKNLKKAEVHTLGDLARSSISDVKNKVTRALEKEGWRDDGCLAEVATTISKQQKKEAADRKFEEKKEKIAKGDFGKEGIEEFLAGSKSVADLETLKKSFEEFKSNAFSGDPDAEEMKKALAFFESLPVGACQVGTLKNTRGVDSFEIFYKAGNGELKKTSISVWDMDNRRDDKELGHIVSFSESATRNSRVNDKIMEEKMAEALMDKGFTVFQNLFGDIRVPLGRILKPKE